MTPFEALLALFADNLPHAHRVAAIHILDNDGRCKACHSAGASSGRTLGCTIGAAARKAIRDQKP